MRGCSISEQDRRIAALLSLARRHLMVLFAIAIIAFIWIIATRQIYREHSRIEARYVERLENLSWVVANNVGRTVSEADTLLKFASWTIKPDQTSNPVDGLTSGPFPIDNKRVQFSLVRADGTLMGSSLPDAADRPSLRKEAEHFNFHRGITTNQLLVGKPGLPGGERSRYIHLSRPLRAPDGALSAIAFASIPLDTLIDAMPMLSMDEQVGIALVGSDDVIRSGAGTYAGQIGKSYREWSSSGTLEGREHGSTLIRSSRDGIPHLVAFRSVESAPLQVIVTMGMDGGQHGDSNRISVIVMIASLCTGLVIWATHEAEKARSLERIEGALSRQRAVNAMQRNFISMASHEFRTPLAVIDSCAQKMHSRMGNQTPENIDNRVAMIRRSIHRITSLMESILVVAKLDDGNLVLSLTGCDANKLIRDCVDRCREQDPNRMFRLSLSPEQPQLRCDVKLIEQVVGNLLSNAMKFSPRKMPIDVTSRVQGSTLVVEISDYGAGIDAADIPRLFTRYFRTASAVGVPGTGIGLYFVKLIAERHRGSVSVRSARMEGSTFTLALPRETAEPLEARYVPPAMLGAATS